MIALASRCPPASSAAGRPAPWTIVGIVLAVLLALMLAGAARAQTFPPFTGLVTDAAGILPADRKAALEQKLEAFQQKTGRQLAVATVGSLEGDEIQDYGYKLGRAWGVGLKDANNGAILLVAPNERKVGIEVGTGLEGVLTDAYSSVIIHGTILPAFKAGDMPGGIDKGADAIIDILSTPDDQARAKEQAAIAAYDKAHQSKGGGLPLGFLFWIILFGVIMLSQLLKRSHGARYSSAGGGGGSNWPIWLWAASEVLGDRNHGGGGGLFGGSGGGRSSDGGGGWGGGGFTGGGGGSFGGGGASGGW